MSFDETNPQTPQKKMVLDKMIISRFVSLHLL